MLLSTGCSLVATRPVQEMSDTASAIRAAKEVQADILTPDLYRMAGEWFFRAKHEYKFKNFKEAREYANKSRYFAEAAEYEALSKGGNRADVSVKDPLDDTSPTPPSKESSSAPYPYPTPEPTIAEEAKPASPADGPPAP